MHEKSPNLIVNQSIINRFRKDRSAIIWSSLDQTYQTEEAIQIKTRLRSIDAVIIPRIRLDVADEAGVLRKEVGNGLLESVGGRIKVLVDTEEAEDVHHAELPDD